MATTKDEARVLGILARYPALGVNAWVDWRLRRQNPAMPHRFYLVGDTVLLVMGVGIPLLYGVPEEAEELEAFLAFAGADRLDSTGWMPAGWQKQEHIVMRREKGYASATPRAKGFEEHPAPSEVMDVLESREKFAPGGAWDAFYTKLCTRVNHGYAEVVGMRNEKGELVSTAGLYAMNDREAYLGAVETRPGFEGKGYATVLVEQLAVRHREKEITLICEPKLERFYHRLGFAATGHTNNRAAKRE